LLLICLHLARMMRQLHRAVCFEYVLLIIVHEFSFKLIIFRDYYSPTETSFSEAAGSI
jgi:hypothetical protein